ncbi:hypothetical protein tb265_20220 [Gemmatimonadetes bacterium T265]|nr:hypothetical protein tb265_20220 [Gemmatimonadetes bacterium T265]
MRRFALLAVLLLASAHARSAAAQSSGYGPYEAGYGYAETFVTPAGAGPLLLRGLDAPGLFAADSAVVGLYAWPYTGVTGGLVGPALFRVVLSRPVYGVALAPAVLLQPNTTYVFTFFPPAGNLGQYGVEYDPGAVFGGESLTCSSAYGCDRANSNATPIHITGFDVSYASTSAPEPSTVALTLAGLAVVGAVGVGRRRKAHR